MKKIKSYLITFLVWIHILFWFSSSSFGNDTLPTDSLNRIPAEVIMLILENLEDDPSSLRKFFYAWGDQEKLLKKLITQKYGTLYKFMKLFRTELLGDFENRLLHQIKNNFFKKGGTAKDFEAFLGDLLKYQVLLVKFGNTELELPLFRKDFIRSQKWEDFSTYWSSSSSGEHHIYNLKSPRYDCGNLGQVPSQNIKTIFLTPTDPSVRKVTYGANNFKREHLVIDQNPSKQSLTLKLNEDQPNHHKVSLWFNERIVPIGLWQSLVNFFWGIDLEELDQDFKKLLKKIYQVQGEAYEILLDRKTTGPILDRTYDCIDDCTIM